MQAAGRVRSVRNFQQQRTNSVAHYVKVLPVQSEISRGKQRFSVISKVNYYVVGVTFLHGAGTSSYQNATGE